MKKTIIKIISSFILNKEKRKEFRLKLKQKYLVQDTSSMKIGVGYSVWDGEELLEASIKSIRNHVHYICVVWQEESWKGQKCNKGLKEFLEVLKKEKLIDEIIFYPHKGIAYNPTKKEREKRNIGLRYALKNKCNYFMTMDTDEFYYADEFEKAKQTILKKGASHTACPLYNYWKSPQYRERDFSLLSVPFIYKINENSKFKKMEKFPAHADATRHIPLKTNDHFFFLTDIAMHHMSYIRNDLEKKLKNASTGSDGRNKILIEKYKNINEKTLEKYELIKVKNIFGIEVDNEKA
ncbi:MAG: hypothetical protein LBR35_02310 [Rickettsiales bacterium]|jgi:hypothetical protein|nr:hypothetical protein [Rickettsiales bacterium]